MEKSDRKNKEEIMLNRLLPLLWYFLFPEIVLNKFLKICKDPNSTTYQLLSFFDVENIEQNTDRKENGLPDFYLIQKEWPCDVALEIKEIFPSGSIVKVPKGYQNNPYENFEILDFSNFKIAIEKPYFGVDLLGKNFFKTLKKCLEDELKKYKQKITTKDIDWDDLIQKIIQECFEKYKQKLKMEKETLTRIYLKLDRTTNIKTYKIMVIQHWQTAEEEWSDLKPKLYEQIYKAKKKFETLKKNLNNNRNFIAVKDIQNILCIYIYSCFKQICHFLNEYFCNLQTEEKIIKKFLVIPEGLHYICFLEF